MDTTIENIIKDEIHDIKNYIEKHYIDEWEKGKILIDENGKKLMNENGEFKRMTVKQTRAIKKNIYDKLKESHKEIYDYLINYLYKYKSSNNNLYDIIELFMTGNFYNLLVELNKLKPIKDLIPELSEKNIFIEYEINNSKSNKDIDYLKNTYNYEVVNQDYIHIHKNKHKENGIKCPCGQSNILYFMMFKRERKLLIIGNDCIRRLECIFHLIIDEDTRNNFLKNIIKANRTIKEKKKEKEQKEREIKDKEDELKFLEKEKQMKIEKNNRLINKYLPKQNKYCNINTYYNFNKKFKNIYNF